MGLFTCWKTLLLRRIKVFSTLQNVQAGYRLYRRGEHGRIMKEFHHLMDAFRYLIMTWEQIAAVQVPTRSATMTPSISDRRAGC